eukprot:873778-Ditylum_brightwellii.AAC.1
MSDNTDTTHALNKSEIRAWFEEAGQSHNQPWRSNKNNVMVAAMVMIKKQNFPFSKPVNCTLDRNLVSSSCKIGLQVIAHGEVAALVPSGGQGTCLGFDDPKGMYDIQMKSGFALF